MEVYAPEAVDGAFDASHARFATVVAWLGGDQAGGVSHAELEAGLQTEGRALLRQLLQDHLDLRASGEQRLDRVVDAEQAVRPSAETGHERWLSTVFGAVSVARIAYRGRGLANLHPADAVLTLPAEKHSHGLRRLAAIEAARGSFDAAAAAIGRATGVRVGKRQVEDLARRAAVDVDSFYAGRAPEPSPDGDALALSFDGKGVVMRPDALRAATATAAGKATRKLATRLSKGEKRNRKRMAEVGAVYDVTPVARTVADILPATDAERAQPRPAPTTRGKWLTTSVTDGAAQVIGAVFDEATRRDPQQRRDWVVLEYLWRAAWCFFDEADRQAEQWVRTHAQAILAGRAGIVAAAIRRKATYHGLDPGHRHDADTAAAYLISKRRYLDYPTALARGWPIATGVIEGACRHLIADRMRYGLTPEERRDFRQLYGDPWFMVQNLLGHATRETTVERYLAPVADLNLRAMLANAETPLAAPMPELDAVFARVAAESEGIQDIDDRMLCAEEG